MSKLIKSDQWIEAHPCRLEPIDVDAFFINDEFPENEDETAEGPTEATTSENNEIATEDEHMREWHEMVARANHDKENPSNETAKESTESENELDLSHISNLAQHLGSIIDGLQETASTQIAEEPVAENRNVLDLAEHEAEQIFLRTKNQANELVTNAYKQADSILDGAHGKLNELTDGAHKRAHDITYDANRKADQFVQEAQQQANFITEAANRKVAQLLEKTKLQTEQATKEAEQKANSLVESAKQQAAALLETTNVQAAELKTKAQQEGFQTGREEGLVQVQQEWQQKLATAIDLLSRADEERLSRIRSSEPELLKLAVGIAEKIIGTVLKLDPGIQLALVKEALAGVSTAGSMTIKVNPADCQFIMDNLPAVQQVFNEPIPIKIEGDQGIISGNCFIETNHGNLDARIKTQLEQDHD